MVKIESKNCLERQKERADNFFHQMKNSLRSISKGNWQKKV